MAKPALHEAVTEFLNHLRAKGKAKNTVDAYEQSLRALIRSSPASVLAWSVTHRHVDAVFSANPQWGEGTRNNRLAHYKMFFKWCRARGYMHRDSDPAFGWDNLIVPNKDRMRVPIAEWPYLFSLAETPTQRIVLATGLFLFLRGSEQQLIQLKHVHLDEGLVEIYRIKTKQWDTMAISQELAPYLRAHMTWLANQNMPHPDHYLIPAMTSPLVRVKGRFVAGTGQVNPERPFCRPYDVVKTVLAKAGYATLGEGEHTLRRSGARAYFDELVAAGYDGALRRVMSTLGHKKSETTERYLGLDLERFARNRDIRGQAMFPSLQNARVVPIRREM